MAEGTKKSNRGFAAMDQDKQREIARKGGQAMPHEKRSFSQDRSLAAEAGRKGGQNVPDEKRSFSRNHELAAQAGRKGGQASHGGRRGEPEAPAPRAARSGGKSQGSEAAERD